MFPGLHGVELIVIFPSFSRPHEDRADLQREISRGEKGEFSEK